MTLFEYYADGRNGKVGALSDSFSELETRSLRKSKKSFSVAATIPSRMHNNKNSPKSFINNKEKRVSRSLLSMIPISEDSCESNEHLNDTFSIKSYDESKSYVLKSCNGNKVNNLSFIPTFYRKILFNKDDKMSNELSSKRLSSDPVKYDDKSLFLTEQEPNGFLIPEDSNLSFSSYLMKSSLKRLKEEIYDNSKQIDKKGLISLPNDFLNVNPINELPLCTYFSEEMNAYIQKMINYSNRLSHFLFSAESGIFNAEEKREINNLLENINNSLNKLQLSCQNAGKNLNMYSTTTKMMTMKAKISEKRITEIIEAKEAALDLRREALLQTSRQLQQERAAIKSILLHSGFKKVTLRDTPHSTNSLLDFNEDNDLIGDEIGWDLDSISELSPTSEVLRKSKENNSKIPRQSSYSILADSSLRREWILDHSLGYFLECKDPPTPECVCAMIARMQPYEMANDVLRSRRQMSLISHLITICPAAINFYFSLLEKRMQEMEKVWKELEKEYIFKKEQLFKFFIC